MYEHLETGYKLYLKQMYSILVKRFLYNRRNWKSMLIQIILPSCFICIAMTVALSAPGFFDLPELELSTAQYFPLTQAHGGIDVPFFYSTPKSVHKNKTPTASSSEIVNTLKYLIGIGSTCVLNKPNLNINDLLNFNFSQNNAKSIFNEKYFGKTPSCQSVFNQLADIDLKYFNRQENLLKERFNESNKYYPDCVCLKDLSGFECVQDNSLQMPPQFRPVTHEKLLNISGVASENDYYLFTTDMYRLKRYGGLSFDNEVTTQQGNYISIFQIFICCVQSSV